MATYFAHSGKLISFAIALGVAAGATVVSAPRSAAEEPQKWGLCRKAAAEILDIDGSWQVIRGAHTAASPEALTQWGCLDANDLIELAPDAPRGSLMIMYLDQPDVRQIPCPTRFDCANAFAVRPPSRDGSTAPGYARKLLAFAASFLRNREPAPVPGILRGLMTIRPSVLCPEPDATLDLTAALDGLLGRADVGFSPEGAGASAQTVFPLRFDRQRRPYIDEFRLSPGLYRINPRNAVGVSEGEGFGLVASVASCARLAQSFELARQYTATWPAGTPARAALNFQSVYLQALARDPANAPARER
jgi:hypothetical protein